MSETRDYIVNQKKEEIVSDEQIKDTVDTSLIEDDLLVAKTTLTPNSFAVREGKSVKVLGVNGDTRHGIL